MNTHPYTGMHATGRTTSNDEIVAGIVESAPDPWLFRLRLDDGSHVHVQANTLVVDSAEARRRLEVAGTPVDYEAIGRGAVREAIAAMSGAGGIAVGSVYQGLAEAMGRGVVSALGRGIGGVSDYLSFPGIVRLIGESIGKGIASARGGAS